MFNKRSMLQGGIMGSLLFPSFTGASIAKRRGPRADYFPNVLLETHEGKKVAFYDDLIAGKVVVINMMYTYCTELCPPTTASLIKVQQALGSRMGRDVHMYSITLQPEFDKPSSLKAYAEKYDIGPGWTFLTGKAKDIETIRQKLGFTDIDPAEDARPMRHTAMLRIGNEKLDRWLMVPAMSSTRQIVSKINGFL